MYINWRKNRWKIFHQIFPFFLIIITSFYFRDQNSTNVYMWKFSLGDRGEIFLCVQIIIKKEWKWSKTYIQYMGKSSKKETRKKMIHTHTKREWSSDREPRSWNCSIFKNFNKNKMKRWEIVQRVFLSLWSEKNKIDWWDQILMISF